MSGLEPLTSVLWCSFIKLRIIVGESNSQLSTTRSALPTELHHRITYVQKLSAYRAIRLPASRIIYMLYRHLAPTWFKMMNSRVV